MEKALGCHLQKAPSTKASVPPKTIFTEYFGRIFCRILFGANLSIRHLTEYSVNEPNIRFMPNIRFLQNIWVLPNIRTILGQGKSVTKQSDNVTIDAFSYYTDTKEKEG